MILPFSTKWPNGQPTCFIEKIWQGLNQTKPEMTKLFKFDWENAYEEKFGELWDGALDDKAQAPKLHTIREDAKDRWHAGCKIHMVVFNRSKNQFQFAPVLECTAVQRIRIWEAIAYDYYIDIDGRMLRQGDDVNELNRIARNDGFESIEKMITWFKLDNKAPLDFTGKIIHWTDLRY